MFDSNTKYRWDNQNVMEYAIQQAEERVRAEEVAKQESILKQTAKKLKKESLSAVTISKATGLDISVAENL